MTEPPPLERFNAQIVQSPLHGLLRNMDSELERQFKRAITHGKREDERKLSLLLLMLRFTKNSYEGVRFLLSDDEENSKRKREFVLVVPPINRQLLDLLFTLVFMIDDFPKRSMDYDVAGYRQARESYDKYHTRFGKHPKWQGYFEDLRALRAIMEEYIPLTPQQKNNPGTIRHWYAPYRLMNKSTKSGSFMKFLEKWLYGETSSQAHLDPGGLYSMALFLVSDLASESERHKIKTRTLEQFRFRHFTRTLTTVLAIATEINNFCHLQNRVKLAELWVLLGQYAEEANDVYKERYQATLAP